MTPKEKVEKIKLIESEFYRKLDILKKNYRAKIRAIKNQITERKMKQLRDDLYR